MARTQAYKVFTHDWRSPIQGGEPIWGGTLPYQLPRVEVDEGLEECAEGWNACREPATALHIAGLWPTGWPSRLCRVETDEPVIERGDKVRAATWTVTEEIDAMPAINALSQVFAPFAAEMVAEQIAWREALARPRRDEAAVRAGLKEALRRRGLDWKLERYNAWAARAAWDARDAWAAWDAGAAWAAWDAWDARDVRDAGAAWDARDVRDAGAARDALTIHFASLQGWVEFPPDLLTAGLRDAYAAGLAKVTPVTPDTLGFTMVS